MIPSSTLPLPSKSSPIGVLSAYSSTGRVYFSREFLQFFRTLAVQLGLGLHNAQLYPPPMPARSSSASVRWATH